MGFIGQSFSPDDLATWIGKYRPDAKGYTINVNESDGAFNNVSNPGPEAALDTQTIAGIVYPLPSSAFSAKPLVDILTELTVWHPSVLRHRNREYYCRRLLDDLPAFH